jgi:pimeloyl-ACP methyl ester carboxylesterase
MEQLELFNLADLPKRPASTQPMDVADPVLKSRLENVSLPKNSKVVGRKMWNGTHVIGIERTHEGRESAKPAIVAIPGFCHGNWSYIKLIEALAEKRMEIFAVSPFGESGSGPEGKRLEEWRLEDFLAAYRGAIEELDREVVLLGHSVGGLMALRLLNDSVLAEKTRLVRIQKKHREAERRRRVDRQISRGRSKIRGVILINSVKPSNICHRLYDVAEKEGLAFLPKEKELPWILNDLFRNEYPEDMGWITEKLNASVGSNKILDEYAFSPGSIVVDAFRGKAALEFCGTEDDGETTGVHGEYDPLKVREMEGAVKGQRISITEFLLREGRPSFAKKIDIQGGSHNSLILGKHVSKVANDICKHYPQFKSKKE